MSNENQIPERIWIRPGAPFGLSALSESSRRLDGDIQYVRVHAPTGKPEGGLDQCYWCKHPDHGHKICPVPYLAKGAHGLVGSYPCGCSLSTVIPTGKVSERDKELARRLAGAFLADWMNERTIDHFESLAVNIESAFTTIRAEVEAEVWEKAKKAAKVAQSRVGAGRNCYDAPDEAESIAKFMVEAIEASANSGETHSSVTQHEVGSITVMCDDGVERTGQIIDMPFHGNEHEFCSLKSGAGDLFSVSLSEVIRVLGRDPRRF